MRLFVAAELPEAVLDALVETQAALRDAVRGRYVAPDSLHLTLTFLGEVPAARVDEVASALERACAGQAPFEVHLGTLGSFGRRRSAVLWQSVEGGTALPALASNVRRELADASFTFDEKPFLAHVTLMRAADLTRGELPMPQMARGVLDTVTLFKSDLSGPRPVNEPLHTVTLGEAQA